LLAVVSTEWIRPLSLPTPKYTYRFAGLWLHTEVPQVAFLGLVHLRILLPLFIPDR
jgi:hypothetical protein